MFRLAQWKNNEMFDQVKILQSIFGYSKNNNGICRSSFFERKTR